ncbi:MAG: hypothetical protein JW841_17700 [Deltaproteobacteria bacterium]|nr:hypothetical protein [Deltaproteobacteria bacterium]
MYFGRYPLFIAVISILVLAITGSTGCAAGPDKQPPVETTLTIWNRTQTEIEELRIHNKKSYSDAENLLAQPLAVEATVEVDFIEGQFVTVFRRRVENDDPTAFTTEHGLDEVKGDGYTLIIFDQSFRLMQP